MLGFKPIGRITDENVFLFAEGNKDYLIHLSKVDHGQKSYKQEGLAKRAGLFHFAILLPNRGYLANVFRHLTENSDKLYFEGVADHLVSESLYLRDPDKNISFWIILLYVPFAIFRPEFPHNIVNPFTVCNLSTPFRYFYAIY